MYDIAIVGAGPAGMTAAIYACRAGKKVVIFEASAYGGQIVTTDRIENYPATPSISGLEFSNRVYEQAEKAGAEFIFERVEKITNDKKIYTDYGEYSAKSIIIASGTRNRRLGLENENHLIGHGISFCATCDGALYKEKDVIVYGGGNTALYSALYLSSFARTVFVIYRGENFRADKILVDKLPEKTNISTLLNTVIAGVSGESKLTSVTISSENGENKRELTAEGLFVAIGQEPHVDFIEEIELEDGYIKSSENCQTNIDGIFVAGDVRTKQLRQLVTAESDGAIAATSACNYLDQM